MSWKLTDLLFQNCSLYLYPFYVDVSTLSAYLIPEAAKEEGTRRQPWTFPWDQLKESLVAADVPCWQTLLVGRRRSWNSIKLSII